MKKFYYITLTAIALLIWLQGSYIASMYNDYTKEISQKVEQTTYETIRKELLFRSAKAGQIATTSEDVALSYNTISYHSDGFPDSVLHRLLSDPKLLEKLSPSTNLLFFSASSRSSLEITKSQSPISMDSIKNYEIIDNLTLQIRQDILLSEGRPVDLDVMDSLLLSTDLIADSFRFVLSDSTKRNHVYSKHSSLNNYKYKTLPYPIGLESGQVLQLHYNVPLSSFLRVSIQSLVGSLLIILIVVFALFMQLTIIRRKQRNLENVQGTINGTIHDLKSPLSSTTMAIDVVKKSLPSDPLKEIAQRSQATINNLIRNIEALLSIAKESKGKFAIHRQKVDAAVLVGICEKVCHDFGYLYSKEQNIAIKNDLPASFTIDADPLYFGSVIGNLVENALKYSDEGVQITISIKEKNSQLFVSVEDNGWGVAPKYQKSLFKQFYQAPNSKDKQKGFGIGLFQVKRIVEAHNGTIKVESTEGRGSKFYFTLPQK